MPLVASTEPVVVLGMHKSGTTLLADTLHHSGIEMLVGDKSASYDQGNKMERAETLALNVALLDCEGRESHRILDPLDPARAPVGLRTRARDLVAGLEARGKPWGFKDPRTLLTIGFWEDILKTPRLIGVFRDPAEVFQHYARKAGRRWISRDPFFLPDSVQAWCVYNRALRDLAQRRPDMLLLNYSSFMDGSEEIERLSSFVGRPLQDRRRPNLRRSSASQDFDYRAATFIARQRYGSNPQALHYDLIMLSKKRSNHQGTSR